MEYDGKYQLSGLFEVENDIAITESSIIKH